MNVMGRDSIISQAREAFLARFVWESGHADIWKVFLSAPTLAAVIAGLAEPWRDAGITHATHLGAGFQAVRKAGGILPGRKISVGTAPDYQGLSHELRMQDVLNSESIVLLVDDWAERGSQADGVRLLVEQSGAHFAGASLLVDQLDDSTREKLGRVTSLVRASELGDPHSPQ
jgi:adenine phosphoribosyltransferase